MTLKQLLEQCSWEQIEAVIPQYPMLNLRSEEDIIEIKYIKSLYERMLQLQPQESRQKIRLFPDPDIDNWIEAEDCMRAGRKARIPGSSMLRRKKASEWRYISTG